MALSPLMYQLSVDTQIEDAPFLSSNPPGTSSGRHVEVHSAPAYIRHQIKIMVWGLRRFS